jgi:low temperature requirement protein LtrA
VSDRERVSTLELFFDLVFVFVLTQLTDVLTEGHDLASLARVAVMLAVIWWMYDGYAWLTNNIETERPRFRVLLLGGMGGFLIIALAVPHANEGDGLVFALAYLAVTLLHSGMYYGGATRET